MVTFLHNTAERSCDLKKKSIHDSCTPSMCNTYKKTSDSNTRIRDEHSWKKMLVAFDVMVPKATAKANKKI